jgi:hypothetical protein
MSISVELSFDSLNWSIRCPINVISLDHFLLSLCSIVWNVLFWSLQYKMSDES